MKKHILKMLSVIIALCAVSGCKENAETEITTTIVAQTTTAATTAVTTKETIDEKYTFQPFPDGWSAEKISALIEIDGIPLNFPCTADEFKSQNKNITLGELDIYTSFCDIFYNDVNIGSLYLNQDSGYCESVMIYTDSLAEIGDISINKCKPSDIEAIASYFNNNFSDNLNPEHFWEDDENYGHYVFQFLDGADLFVLSFVRNKEMIEMISISLRSNTSQE